MIIAFWPTQVGHFLGFKVMHLLANELKQTLSVLAAVMKGKRQIPIMNCVLIDAEQSRFTATDAQTQISVAVTTLSGDDGWRAAIPFAKLNKIVSALPKDQPVKIKFNDKGERVTINCPGMNTNYRISCFRGDDFPTTTDHYDAVSTFTIPADHLLAHINKVVVAAAKNDVRYFLNGVLFDCTEKGVILVATDGHRLIASELTDAVANGHQSIMSINCVSSLQSALKLLGDSDVDIQFGDRSVSVKAGGKLVIDSKLIDGRYPQYQQLITEPSGEDVCVVAVNTEALMAAVNRVISVYDDANHTGVRLSVDDQRMRIESAITTIADEADDVIALEKPVTTAFTKVVNSHYLIDLLKSINDDVVTFVTSSDPMSLIYCQHNQFKSVLMPMLR
jgi:DNA polymerase-3 subunit beta